MTFDDVGEPPPRIPPAAVPVKTPCIGGPWHGATITHWPEDTADRTVIVGPIAGYYQHDYRDMLWHWYELHEN